MIFRRQPSAVWRRLREFFFPERREADFIAGEETMELEAGFLLLLLLEEVLRVVVFLEAVFFVVFFVAAFLVLRRAVVFFATVLRAVALRAVFLPDVLLEADFLEEDRFALFRFAEAPLVLDPDDLRWSLGMASSYCLFVELLPKRSIGKFSERL